MSKRFMRRFGGASKKRKKEIHRKKIFRCGHSGRGGSPFCAGPYLGPKPRRHLRKYRNCSAVTEHTERSVAYFPWKDDPASAHSWFLTPNVGQHSIRPSRPQVSRRVPKKARLYEAGKR
jgi:hypothetical protein